MEMKREILIQEKEILERVKEYKMGIQLGKSTSALSKLNWEVNLKLT